MTYPRYAVNLEYAGTKIQAWPHGLCQHGPRKGQWSWCVQLTRPGDSKPANVVGRNRPGWPEFHHREDAFAAAETVHMWAAQHRMLELLPVDPGLRMVHRLADYMEERESARVG